ncbi:hypothetical protein HELRODRAFT_176969 [Helobdella robusta]|uniref:Fucolectin tachylectin-4 pentraxin-1 domain-containing protein n=1 Tax=Helobdella robusta TaxID=6412 RepID=T1FB30_HELRO|nr:hypothetical protein HELRODRAFT_176969 [Helobdella robusta]ESN98494.1 hypothetical protein HELRODRAFT_176969 [Helobdella robusta]
MKSKLQSTSIIRCLWLVISSSTIVNSDLIPIIGSRNSPDSTADPDHVTSLAYDNDESSFAFVSIDSESSVAWFQFDLGAIYIIDESHYLTAYMISASIVDSTDLIPDRQVCYLDMRAQPPPPRMAVRRLCLPDMLFGRYITIEKQAQPYLNKLAIAEVRIYGTPKGGITDVTRSKELVKLVRQNFNEFEEYPAGSAIDGQLNTCSFTATEYKSLRGKVGWWQVEFAEEVPVKACLLSNVKLNDFDAYNYMETFAVVVTKEADELPVSNDLDLATIKKDSICYTYNRSHTVIPEWGTVLYLPCQRTMLGRYVTVIQMSPGTRKDAMNICEFSVLQTEQPSTSTTTTTTTTATTTTTTITTTTTTSFTTSTDETTNPVPLPTSPTSSSIPPPSSSSSTSSSTSSTNNGFVPIDNSSSSSSSPSSSSSSSQSNAVALGVGLGIGLGIPILIALAVLAFCCRHKIAAAAGKKSDKPVEIGQVTNAIYVHPRDGLTVKQKGYVEDSVIMDLPYDPSIQWENGAFESEDNIEADETSDNSTFGQRHQPQQRVIDENDSGHVSDKVPNRPNFVL